MLAINLNSLAIIYANSVERGQRFMYEGEGSPVVANSPHGLWDQVMKELQKRGFYPSDEELDETDEEELQDEDDTTSEADEEIE